MRWLQLTAKHRCDFITQLWVIFLPVRDRILKRLKAYSVVRAQCPGCSDKVRAQLLSYYLYPQTDAFSKWSGKWIKSQQSLGYSFCDLFFHRYELDHVTTFSCLWHSSNLCLSRKGRISWTSPIELQKQGLMLRLAFVR